MRRESEFDGDDRSSDYRHHFYVCSDCEHRSPRISAKAYEMKDNTDAKDRSLHLVNNIPIRKDIERYSRWIDYMFWAIADHIDISDHSDLRHSFELGDEAPEIEDPYLE